MSYLANNENRPNNMAQRYRALQRETQCDSGINRYSDNRRKFMPPVQSRAITNTHSDGESLVLNTAKSRSNLYTNSNQPSSVFKTPMDVNRMVSVAGPSRIQRNSCDASNAGSSVFNNPHSTYNNTSRDNISMDNRRTNSIAAGVSGMNVQETISTNTTPIKKPAELNSTTENSTASNFNFRVFGSSESEKMFIFTGTVEKVIKWNKIFRNHFCYFEVIAAVISIQEGSIKTQRIMLLRDRKGPILQVVYYVTTHMDIEDFHVGQILRCIGKMSATNLLNAISIRSASQEEIDTLQRLSLICDQAISHFLNA